MHRFPLSLLLAAAVLTQTACTAPAHPWAPRHQSIPGQAGALTPAGQVRPHGTSTAAAADGAAFALFYGVDDYTGSDTQDDLQAIHAQLATVGSTDRTPFFLSGDSNVKDDGFRTRVTRGQAWGAGFTPLGELQTNHTPDLRDFLAWVGREAPRKPLHLTISTHGGGYGGILLDYDGKPGEWAPSMTLKKANKALAKGHVGPRIDTLTFDACMMASIEVGEAIKGSVAIMTGTEDFSMGGSTPFDEVATQLAAGKTTGGEAFARHVTEAIVKRGKWGERGSATWSAIVLDRRFDVLVRDVDRLAGALRKALPAERAAIRAAAAGTRNFAIMKAYEHEYGDFQQRDLIELCRLLGKHVKDPHVQASARTVEASTKAVVLAFARMPSEPMANGLAIFLPQGEAVAQKLPEYRDSLFARHTQWDEFLAELAQDRP